MKISDKYSKSLKDKWVTRFITNHPDEDNYDGVVMSISKSFIVIKEAKDFEFDGTVILPKKTIRGYRDSKFEQCYNSILRKNGQFKNLKTPDWMTNCTSIRDIIHELMRHNVWPGIEVLLDEEKESAFYIGPIVETLKNSFSIKCYNAAGEWENVYRIDYKDIFRMEFDSKYCNYFNDYMKLA